MNQKWFVCFDLVRGSFELNLMRFVFVTLRGSFFIVNLVRLIYFDLRKVHLFCMLRTIKSPLNIVEYLCSRNYEALSDGRRIQYVWTILVDM